MLKGERLDRPTYSFLHTLDEGNTAVCVRGFHDIFQREVVQKTISMLGVSDGVGREPELLKRLQHERIVEVWEAQWDPDPELVKIQAITFVTPYYEGGSIYTALVEGYRFGVHQVMQIADDALAALDAMHGKHGVLHRDVKPANIMLDKERRHAYLGDLGSAAHIDPATGGASSRVGSPLYQAPEARPNGLVTPRSDLYALGVTLVEMLNSRFQYEDLDRNVIDARLDSGRRALADRYYAPGPWVPKPLATFVRGLCNTDSDKRPQDAATALRSLRDIRVVDWRRTDGEGLEGTWQGHWPPEARRSQQRIHEIRTEAIVRGPNGGKLSAVALWRNPNGKWRTYAKLKCRIDADAPSLARFFRSVEAKAQAAPTR